MRFGSVCSGIEAASVAWESLGWKAAWFSEIDPFASDVLKFHFPDISNLGDMKTLPERILSGEIEAPDILCGGCPCQAFSVAGRRESLNDERGNLSLIFCEIADAIDTVRKQQNKPESIIFYENVPGILNTKDNAFGCFLGRLVGSNAPLLPEADRWSNAGYVVGSKRQIAWRVLNAEHFGVPQRRHRVFVVGCSSSERRLDPSQILFECKGLSWGASPSSHAWEKPSTRSKGCTGVTGFREGSFGQFVKSDTGAPIRATGGYIGGGGETIVVNDR